MTTRVAGPVALDLHALQSPSHRHRGVGRYVLEYVQALHRRHPALLGVALGGEGPLPKTELDALVADGLLRRHRGWDGRAEVYHVLSPYELEVPAEALWPRRASAARLVVTVYDLIPEVMAGTYLQDPALRARYRARHQLVRAADHVMTLSASAASDVVEVLGISPERVSVVGAACGPQWRRPPSQAEARARARRDVEGLGDGYIAYNGAIEPRKNVERLIEAYAALPAEDRERWQLVVACRLQPLERNHLEVRARQLGIEGRLVLTGHVAEATLVALYQGAELVAFPSLYEGYGLPIVEAMACGAPVVASATSSMAELVSPEGGFDPRSTVEITAALHRGLTPGPARARLLAWSEAPPPRWDDVVDRAAAVYEALARPDDGRPGGQPGTAGPPRRHGARRRLAVVTPWPPALTGVAGYSRRLVDALVEVADVDLYIDGGGAQGALGAAPTPGSLGLLEAGGAGATGIGQVLPAGWFERGEAFGGPYDGTVVCLGNSEFHLDALRLLRSGRLHRPVVLAHDVVLHNLLRFAGDATPDPGEGSGPAGAGGPGGGGADGAEALTAARHVIALSARFLCTSPFAANLARLQARPGDRGRVGVLPFAYPEPWPAVGGAGRSPGLVCAFGVVDPAKGCATLVRALPHLVALRPGATLVLVGPVADALRQELEALAAAAGVGGHLRVTGPVSQGEYDRWLGTASVAVQLRATSNGETSAAVADCLAAGVPAVVTDLGPAPDLGDAVVHLPAGAAPGDVADVLDALLGDPGQRSRLATAGRRYAAERGFARAARSLVAVLDEEAR